MKRNDWKCLIDALVFVVFCSIAAIGMLLAFVIPGGKGPDASKVFMGLHRHDWGDIHFNLALFLMGLLILHVWLNWTWVTSSTRAYFGERWKKVLLGLCSAWVIVLFLSWLIMKL